MILTLLTDFGLADHYVGVMKGVILSICPAVRLVDISHEVTPYAILEAAYTLSQAWSYFPTGSIHLIVVDPGVGSSRRPLLAEAGGHYFIAPDNGVLTMILDRHTPYSVRHITAQRYFAAAVSQTFHGRDIFGPVAGHLAAGVPAANFGPAVENPVLLPSTRPVRISSHKWHGAVLKTDRFGNIITNFEWESFREIAGRPFELIVGKTAVRRYHANYSSAMRGEPFVVKGSSGYLEVSLKQEHAANTLQVSPGIPLEMRWL